MPLIERFDAALVSGPDLIVAGTGTTVADQLVASPYAMTVSPNGQNYFVIEDAVLQRQLIQLGKGGRKVLATINSVTYQLQLLPHTSPTPQLVGGPRLPGRLIYQNEPGGSWQRTSLSVAVPRFSDEKQRAAEANHEVVVRNVANGNTTNFAGAGGTNDFGIFGSAAGSTVHWNVISH